METESALLKKKSFTFSESALYLTAKINEQGPGRKATQTCISAQWPVLIGSLLEALIYLNAGRRREEEEEEDEDPKMCLYVCV